MSDPGPSMRISLPVKCVQLSMMENHCGSYSVTLCRQRINVKLKDITTQPEVRSKKRKEEKR